MNFRRVGPLLLLLAITIAFYWKTLLVHQFSVILGYEGPNQTFAWFNYWVNSVRTGNFPIWDPYTFSGHAFAGEMQTGAFYPFYLLFLLMPMRHNLFSANGYHYFVGLTHFACACLMYALARELRLSRFAAIVAAIAFSMGGIMARLNGWPHLLGSGMWLPLIFLLLLRALHSKTWLTTATYSALTGLSLALSILAGGLHLVMMEGFVIISAAVFHAAITKPPPGSSDRAKWMHALAAAAIALAFAFAGGAVQLLPSVEYSRQAFRFIGSGGMVSATERIPYVHLGDALWPFSIVGMIFQQFAGSQGTGEYLSPYMGVFPAMLAIIGIRFCWRVSWVRYLTGLALAAFLCSLGSMSALHGLLYALVPYFSIAREADRFMYLADFSFAILAGYGLDALLSANPSASWEGFDRIFKWAAILSALALLWPLVLGRGDLSPWISLSLLLIISSYGVFRYLRGAHHVSWAQFLVVSLIFFDLNAFDWTALNKIQEGLKGTDAMQQLMNTRKAADFLKSQSGTFRVDLVAESAPNIGDVFGVETLAGNAVTIGKDYNVMRGYPDLLNARYLMRPASVKDPAPVYEDSHWKIYERPGYYPRAWLVHDTVVEPDAGKLFGRLSDRSLDLHRTALVGAPLGVDLSPAPDANNESVTVRRPGNNSLEVEAHAQGQALLVLSETFYPGWHARVNGKEARIHKVDGDLRGIVVPAGFSRIRLTYAPASVYFGLALSIASALAAGVLLSLALRRRRAQSDETV